VRLGKVHPHLAGALADLPTSLDAEQVADLTGLSTWKLYEAARLGELPPALTPIRVGRRLFWPAARVLDALGLLDTRSGDDDGDDGGWVIVSGNVTSQSLSTGEAGSRG
jgi:hypothetical protein